MHTLTIDLETYSDVPIAKSGLYRYAEDPSFEILLLGYSLDGAEPQVIDLAQGVVMPPWLTEALRSPAYIKQAYNAAFEFTCLSRFLPGLDVSQWRCSMLHALYCGYPASLDAAGKALGLPQDKQKLSAGKALIRYFCCPCTPTKANGGRLRNLPKHDPDKWALFKQYNAQDVAAELAIDARLAAFPVPDFVQKQWETDLRINARGVAVNLSVVEGALAIDRAERQALTNEAKQLTRLANPNSVAQLTQWLAEALDGAEITDLRKDSVARLLGCCEEDPNVRRVLEIRQALGKTSTKKYDAIESAVCSDSRVRGLLQFYGARTGRWAGRLVQVQNLPRTYLEPLDLARDLTKAGNSDALRLIYGSVPDTLSQLVRTAFTASPGNVLIDADFSAIEARVIAWLAGEAWRLEVFRTHGKIYEASASQMFGVPLEQIKKGNPEYALRQRGKVAELALGYQGGVPAMRQMDTGKLLADLSDEEVGDMVRRWRKASPAIVALWRAVEDAARSVAADGGTVQTHGLTFAAEYSRAQNMDFLTIRLPSGRKLYYADPHFEPGRMQEQLSYFGQNQAGKWVSIPTYGGRLTENIVQAIARDCLAEAIERLEAAGLPVVFHVHDEVVLDVRPWDTEAAMLAQVVDILSQRPAWAPDLPLTADGWVGAYFRKD